MFCNTAWLPLLSKILRENAILLVRPDNQHYPIYERWLRNHFLWDWSGYPLSSAYHRVDLLIEMILSHHSNAYISVLIHRGMGHFYEFYA